MLVPSAVKPCHSSANRDQFRTRHVTCGPEAFAMLRTAKSARRSHCRINIVELDPLDTVSLWWSANAEVCAIARRACMDERQAGAGRARRRPTPFAGREAVMERPSSSDRRKGRRIARAWNQDRRHLNTPHSRALCSSGSGESILRQHLDPKNGRGRPARSGRNVGQDCCDRSIMHDPIATGINSRGESVAIRPPAVVLEFRTLGDSPILGRLFFLWRRARWSRRSTGRGEANLRPSSFSLSKTSSRRSSRTLRMTLRRSRANTLRSVLLNAKDANFYVNYIS